MTPTRTFAVLLVVVAVLCAGVAIARGDSSRAARW